MFAILLAALASADAEPASKEPPRILTASVKDGKLVSRVTHTVAVPVTTLQKVKNKDGKEETVTVTTVRTEMRTRDLSFDLAKATISTAGGKKLDHDALKKKLAKPQPVVISADGNAVHESYLKLFDKDAIVIVVPIPKMLEAPVPAPAPPVEKKRPVEQEKKG